MDTTDWPVWSERRPDGCSLTILHINAASLPAYGPEWDIITGNTHKWDRNIRSSPTESAAIGMPLALWNWWYLI